MRKHNHLHPHDTLVNNSCSSWVESDEVLQFNYFYIRTNRVLKKSNGNLPKKNANDCDIPQIRGA